jgi:hypothetical protein
MQDNELSSDLKAIEPFIHYLPTQLKRTLIIAAAFVGGI